MTSGDSISNQSKGKENEKEKDIKVNKVKSGVKGADSDSDQEHPPSSPPNLFCSLPSSKSPLPSQPIPLAFLHRIVAENRIKNGLPLEDYQYWQDKSGSNDAASSSSDGPAIGEVSRGKNGLGGVGGIGSGMETDLGGSNMAQTSDDNPGSSSSSGDSTLLPGRITTNGSSSSSLSMNHSNSSIESDPQTSSAPTSQIEPPQPSQTEPEAPWFSQLASLPHLRSAGIPPIAPNSTSNPSKSFKSKEKAGIFGSVNMNSDGRPNTSSGSGITRNNSPNHHYSSPSVQSSPGHLRPKSFSGLEGQTNHFASFGAASESSFNFHPAIRAPQQQPSTPLPKPIPISQALNLSPEESLDELLLPPDNFSMVNTWVYRSSFPKKKHFPFLKSLGLRSVLTLILEEYPEQNTKFLDEQGIKFFQYGIPGNKEPFVQIPEDKITAALVTILDRRNHPMLIHCNKGKHRTGCLIGCLRKLQQWSLTTIFDEYRRFSFPKSRSMDQEFIELYAENEVWKSIANGTGDERVWLPEWSVISSQLASLPPQISQASQSQHRQLILSPKHHRQQEDPRYQIVRGM